MSAALDRRGSPTTPSVSAAAPDDVADERRPRHRGRSGWRRLAGPAATVVLSTLAMAQALRVWDWRPGTPLEYEGDSVFVLMQVKDILDHGWYWANPSVGAPFGQNAGWFSDGSWVHYLAIKVLGVFSSSPATVGALYFFVCFPMAALAGYWLARRLGVRTEVAVLVGVLFSVMPSHQHRFGHLWLSGYWVLPLAIGLVLLVSGRLPSGRSGQPGGSGQPGQVERSETVRRRATIVVLVVVVGLGGAYFAAFSVILLLASTLVETIATRDRRRMWRGLAASAAVSLLCLVPLGLSVRAARGDVVTGPTPGPRDFGQSELYAGKIMDLLLPWVRHRVAELAQITAVYDRATVPSPEQPALGIVPLVGVCGLLLVGLAYMVGKPSTPARPLVSSLALLTIVSVAFYTRGGLGTLSAILVTPQIRTWSRLVLVIGLLGLVGVGLALTRHTRARSRAYTLAVVGTLVVVGVLDQTNPDLAPRYDRWRSDSSSVHAYVVSLEQVLPTTCSVFQYPVVPFPEQPPQGRMQDYDQLQSYVESTHLTWSYGAMRGTSNADWQLTLPALDGRQALVDDVAAAGFCALELDTAGVASPSAASAALTSALGPPIAATADGRLQTFDLRPHRATMVSSNGETAVAQRGQTVLHRIPGSP